MSPCPQHLTLTYIWQRWLSQRVFAVHIYLALYSGVCPLDEHCQSPSKAFKGPRREYVSAAVLRISLDIDRKERRGSSYQR